MNTSPNKSRRTTLLVLSVIGIAILLCVVLMRDEPGRGISNSPAAPNSSNSFPDQPADDSASAPVPPPPRVNRPVALSPPTPSALPAPGDTTFRVSYQDPEPLGSPSGNFVITTGSDSTAFGVVDLKRLLASRPAGTNSTNALASLLREIKHITAGRARAHGFAYVFDTSGLSLTGTPFIFTNDVPDITDEVLQELSQ